MANHEFARSPFVQVTLPVFALVIGGLAFVHSSLHARLGTFGLQLERVHSDLRELNGRVAIIEQSVLKIESRLGKVENDVAVLQSDVKILQTDVDGLTRKVENIEERHLRLVEDTVTELRKLKQSPQYGLVEHSPYVYAQVMDVLRGREIRLPVTTLVPNAGATWTDRHVGVKYSGNRFTAYPDTGNEELVEVFTNNHWKPVDTADLSKGLVETLR